MIIYDTISADQIEDGDQILVDGDPLDDVIRFADVDGYVFLSGYSHNTGDRESYNLHPEKPVELWTI